MVFRNDSKDCKNVFFHSMTGIIKYIIHILTALFQQRLSREEFVQALEQEQRYYM